MEKDRLIAFFDALLAIIMTVLVLELKKPDPISWEGLWAIRGDLFAYVASFFWLSALWSSNNAEWDYVRVIDRRVVWWVLVFLFFTSLVPYATSLLSNSFYDPFPQAFYGMVIVMTAATNMFLYSSLIKADKDNGTLRHFTKFNRSIMPVDFAIKACGLIVSLVFWAPAASVSVIIAAGVVLGHLLIQHRSSRLID
ncbi:TMEM175 family protein [Olsenella sp. HMSC062G07]|uniref:TMEM175 family protein n=1 Tax=Olsenella sp. HMSC062G07 TaxID=1739330 RepID=UPI0008A2B7F9|nr:TMEM175 family protein [Olsenella sp. HMSC062G07]